MVNLELYRAFYKVAKCGSLTKAAEELYISQPAVSQAIKQLESGLSCQLFVRTHKGMELSETGGKQIFPAIEQALKLIDEAENKLTELKDTATGVVKICASDSVSTHCLIPVIKKYHEKYPEVDPSELHVRGDHRVFKNEQGRHRVFKSSDRRLVYKFTEYRNALARHFRRKRKIFGIDGRSRGTRQTSTLSAFNA